MESKSDKSPLIVIVGETASGKTALALDLAELFHGEIICADSRTVYKGLDIGTAKPNQGERGITPHHILDEVTPDQPFTAATFQQLASESIRDISGRGHLPFLVGGTGLYVDSVLFDFEFRGVADPDLRENLQQKTVSELQDILRQKGIPLPENNKNPRHLIRAIETAGIPSKRSNLRDNTLILGLRIDREDLRAKLERRVDAMVEQGLVEETRRASTEYGWDAPGLQATGYKAFRRYIEGEVTLEHAKALFIQNDLRLAKRQRTWFRRNKSIHWICKKEEAVELITTFMNNIPTAK